MSCPIPHNEIERLEALHRLNILGTEPTPEFDAIAALAAKILDAPIAIISFMDRDIQWFKARVGLDQSQTSRQRAFCCYTILGDKAFEIEDATRDERFRNNPLVTGEPYLRYYLGLPISLDGKTNVATLCVIDTRPRRATHAQLLQMEHLRVVLGGLVGAYQSAARARTAEQQAQRRGMLLSQVEKIARIGAWSLDTDRLTFEWSPQIFAIHELSGGEPPDLAAAQNYFPDYEKARVAGKIRTSIETGVPLELEADFTTALGNRKRVRAIGEIEERDDGARLLVGIFKDITEQYEQNQRLWQAAHLDSLTGIANRHSFQMEIERRLSVGGGGPAPLALLMLDLDNFKDINDELGHLAGDEVLRETARRISHATTGNAFCARLGGDEFAVLMTIGPDTAAPETLAETLVIDIAEPVYFGEHEIEVGVSIGIATSLAHSTSEDELLAKSDLALYHVKQTGRGKVQTYEPAITETLEKKRQSVALVRTAIAQGGLEPFYQPIVDLKTQEIRGVEALVRIRLSDGSISGPADFWHALLDPHCAPDIDVIILERALRDFARWKRSGLDLDFMSINASSASIQSTDFVDRIFRSLSDSGVSSRELKIEVVESVFLGNDSTDVRDVLKQLSASGISIALDDFGTGYASLSHLRDFPIDCIKIDKSFILGLGRDSCNTAIVQALIGLGRSMDLQVIAEGVETEGQLDFVTSLGSNFGQGYLFAKPMDAAGVEALLTCSGSSGQRISSGV